MRRIRTAVALVAIALPLIASARTAADLQLAIRKLNVVGSALYIAAHPDDENTAMLAWLGNERLLRTAYLSMTRGEGGQNLIGNEKGELLGVIRTQELLAARRIDRSQQFFSSASDFGYSKTPQETLAIWNHDAVLGDVVRVIRTLQPDVIITRFPTTGEGGHGQHTASAILAQEAFVAAGDPTKYPEQLQTLAPWTPKRIFWNRFSWQRIDPKSPEVANDIRVDIGAYNPLLGRAYTELAAESRSQHKSQGFGSAERRGSLINYFKQTGGAPATKDLLEGVDLSWSRYPGGERLSQILTRADATFDPSNPQKSIPVLFEAYDELIRLGASDAWSPKANPWIAIKQEELAEVIKAAAGIAIDVSAGQSFVVPGAEVPVSVNVVNRSEYPFTLAAVVSPLANPGKAPGTLLKYNEPVKTDISLKIPDDEAYPESTAPDAPPITLAVTLQDPQLRTLVFRPEVVYRWTDPVAGEKTRPLQVVPPVTANAAEGVYLFPDTKPRTVSVQLRSFAPSETASVRLVVPGGWKTVPESAPVKLDAAGDEARVAFTVTPPPGAAAAQGAIEVKLANGKTVHASLTEIDYEHIPAQRVLRPSAVRLVRADVKKRGERIGYIMGSGDDVPAALRQMGYQVELLNDADLDRADFSRYDAVVVGVRAYNTRKRLKLAHAKLMQYVENGGTVVTQYNTSGDDLAVPVPGPYPFKISRDRVTVETAPVRLVDPNHPLLTTPNKITSADFDGWVQERGLYFTADWDKKYTTILASNDPGEPEREGGELYVRHGKGVFIYTSYVWFRELPAGVPGAYRLFANLVSAR